MKIIKLLIISSAIISLPVQAVDTEALTKEARGVSMSFGKALKGHLMGGMKAGGPVNALTVCNTKAPEVTQAAGQSSGWGVARTSLKLRNTSNAPDAWERSVLQQFEERKIAGEDITKMEATEVINADGRKTFRYMKAVPTVGPCVLCHGAEIAPEVEAKIKQLYPQDKARGFKPGDIRGAFTLQKAL